MKIAVIYLKVPGILGPVELGIAVVIKDDTSLENAKHLVRQVLEREIVNVTKESLSPSESVGVALSTQKAVAIALKSAGYDVVTCSKRIVVEVERRPPS